MVGETAGVGSKGAADPPLLQATRTRVAKTSVPRVIPSSFHDVERVELPDRHAGRGLSVPPTLALPLEGGGESTAMVARAGFEPAISGLKGRRPSPLDERAWH